MWLALGIACVGLHRGGDVLARDVLQGDAVLVRGHDVETIDAALAMYMKAILDDPTDAAALGRVTRCHALLAMLSDDPVAREAHWSSAKAFGVQCLSTEPSFGGVMATSGGVVTDRALLDLDARYTDCLMWTSIAWGRWLEERGPAGVGIDLEPVRLLAARAVALDGERDHGRPHAALGLALALVPNELSPDLDSAGKELALARGDAAPEVAVDFALHVWARQGRQSDAEAALRTAAEDASLEPEHVDAKRRAQRALDDGW